MLKIILAFPAGFACALLAVPSVAQETPADLGDLVGARAAGAETEMGQRGYAAQNSQAGDDRRWTNWWNAEKSLCVTVATVEGRYDSITSTLPADCGVDSVPATEIGALADLSDLVGARAAGAETAMMQRGYASVSTQTGDDRKWTNWWNESRKQCVTVATVEGRYDAITPTLPADCGR